MMSHSVEHNSRPNRVTALFGDHEQSFEVSQGTTLAQLAERVADLAWSTQDRPKGVSVVFAAEPQARANVPDLVKRRRTLVGLPR